MASVELKYSIVDFAAATTADVVPSDPRRIGLYFWSDVGSLPILLPFDPSVASVVALPMTFIGTTSVKYVFPLDGPIVRVAWIGINSAIPMKLIVLEVLLNSLCSGSPYIQPASQPMPSEPQPSIDNPLIPPAANPFLDEVSKPQPAF